ncbi:uncharacterized protein N7511_001885 [Penicillium nucicola]|uniref:uncharacterized protein n=1 Tax=Penicillium nucicola TaxID=1850975 RepID=UPI0025457156|nr:uncharacterized protein N7511_001885 [Penicillium nucicola]KAJ5769834.1 hypothetical protein N7511_001885 [Penicillium nucicola]
MLKRNAQGPQGSKDGDGGFGMGTPDDKPSRATAAQLASRKIKDVRKRRAPTPSGGASDTGSFNPFASTAPAAPAASAPSSAGFTFGQQSQSFPGASAAPAPTQSGMFSSGANGSSGFSFGSGPTSFGSPPPSNPFSVSTSFGGNTQPSTNGFSFGGFNAGGQGSQSFPGFGAQQNTSTPTKSGMFGQQTAASPADDSMQTSPDAKPKSMFASQPAVGGTAPTNPFATLSGQGASNIFAPKTTTTEGTASKPAEAPAFKPLFGAAASNPSTGEKETPAVNIFAPKTTTTAETATKPAETPAFKPLFGAAASNSSQGEKEKPTASNPFANISAQASTSTNLFGGKTPTEETPAKPTEAAKPFGSLFGATTTPKASEPVGNLFASKPAGDGLAPSNPFANLSGQSSLSGLSSPKVNGSESAAKPVAESPFKSMFGAPATSKPADAEKEKPSQSAFGNMFAPKPAADTADRPAEQTPFTFGASATPKPSEGEKEKPASSNLFASKPAATPSFGSLFGASSSLSKPEEGQTTPVKPSNPFANLSGQTPAGNPFAPKSVSSEQTSAETPEPSPFKSLFGSSSVAKPVTKETGVEGNDTVNAEKKTPNNTGPVSQNTTSAPAAPSSVTASGVPSSSSSKQSASTSCLPGTPTSIFPSSSSSSSSLPPYILPPDILSAPLDFSNPDSLLPKPDTPVTSDLPDLNADMPLGHSQWGDHKRINNLVYCRYMTHAFKAEIAKLDPEQDCPDDIIMLYAEMRRNIGVPIGSSDLIEHELTFGSIRPDPTHPENIKSAAERAAAASAQDAAPVTATTTSQTGSSVAATAAQDAAPVTATTTSRAGSPVAASTAPPAMPQPVNDTSSTVDAFARSFSSPVPATAPTATASTSATPAMSASVNGLASTPATTSAPSFGAGGFRPSASAAAFTAPTATSSTSATPAISASANGLAPTPATASAPSFGAGGFRPSAQALADSQKISEMPNDPMSENSDSEVSDSEDEDDLAFKAKVAAQSKMRTIYVPGEGFKTVPADEAAPAAPAASTVSAAPAPASAPPASPAPSSSLLFGVPASGDSSAGSSIFGNAPSSSTSSIFGGSTKPVPSTQNIFGGLKPTSPKRKADDSDSEDDSPAKKPKPSPPSAPTAPPAGSLFGRISAPPPSSTGQNLTWKPNTPIQFGNSQPANGAPAATPAPAAPQLATAAADDEEGEPGEIFDLAQGNGGEEDETVVFEEKCRAFKLTTGWTSQATGPVRLLKHPVTGRARIVIRAEPSGNVVLNTLLKKELVYSMTTNSVQLMVPVEGGKATQWAVRVKREKLNEFFNLVQEIKN